MSIPTSFSVALLSAFACGACASDKAPDQTADKGADNTPSPDAASEPMPNVPGPMRVVSWNCHNLYDDTPNNCGDYCPYEEQPTPGEYKAKIAGIARGLQKLDGDVVVLQEVENKGVLDDLAAHQEIAGMGYQFRELVFGNDPRGINIGLLSRVPFDAYISHKEEKFTRIDNPATLYRFARDAVEVHMTYRGRKVGFVGVHFKSKNNDDDPDRRVAEAQQARAIADSMVAANPDMYVFIVGDFNDTPDTDTFRAVQDGPRNDSLVYQHALTTIASEDRYTYEYGSGQQLLDHLMASPNADARLNANTATIIHDGSLPSDHAPLAATYTVP